MAAKKRTEVRQRSPVAPAEPRPDPATSLEARLSPRRLMLLTAIGLAVAALVRGLYLLEFGGRVIWSADTEAFVALGRRIAAGDVLLRGGSLVFSPLYAYFLGAVFAVFGEAHVAVLVLQFLLGVVSAFVLHRLAMRLFDPLSALFTLGLFCLYGVALVYEGQLLDASFSVLLPTLFLYLLHRAPAHDRLPGWLAAGVALGLFALTRPNVMLFFPLVGIWACLPVSGPRPARRRITALAGLVLGVVLCFAPFLVRNILVLGEPVLITSHGGINFYVGNNENATGFFTPPAGMPPIAGVFNLEVPRQAAEEETGRTGMSDSEVSSYWFGRGLDFVRERPGLWGRLTLRKTRAFFNGFEVPLNVDVDFVREISWSVKIAFIPLAVVMPLGLLGMFLAAPRWRTHLIFYLFFASYSVSVILFFVSARYRLPVVPVLLLYAGFTLRTALAWARRPGPLLGLATALLVLLLAVNANLPVVFNAAFMAHSRGYTLESLGRTDEAVARYEEALRLNPGMVLSHVFLARIHARRGDEARAGAHYAAALALTPEDAELMEEARAYLASPAGRVR